MQAPARVQTGNGLAYLLIGCSEHQQHRQECLCHIDPASFSQKITSHRVQSHTIVEQGAAGVAQTLLSVPVLGRIYFETTVAVTTTISALSPMVVVPMTTFSF